ncbi:MAG TPA: GntR family transcriptional regulator [Rhodanobacteraceae bacterium]|nr:GntR family transcriptional regulator [Rhodanobacteraceae bacterium]
MSITWNDSAPIYRQLRERMVAMILDGNLAEGDALPSVRTVAADYQINPLTVSRAYQELVDENIVEKRRGLGMFVTEGAHEALLKAEREQFLQHEWPPLRARLQRLGLDLETLLRQPPAAAGGNPEDAK